MKHSYFILIFLSLDYPLYVAFDGFVSIDCVRINESLRTVIRRVFNADTSDALIERCPCREFKIGLIKVDFRVNHS